MFSDNSAKAEGSGEWLVPSSLHQDRLDAVLGQLQCSGARRVADLGCGSGAFLRCLVANDQFERIVGFDISSEAIYRARSQPVLQDALATERLALIMGSFLSSDLTRERFDAVVLLEALEHVDPRHLSQVERNLFGVLRPKTIIITTPNAAYNSLYGLHSGQFRHTGHRFEWAQEKFRTWSTGLAERNHYSVVVSGIGPADRHLGPPSQLAVFTQ